MPEPTDPQDINLHVSFQQPEPRPPKRHPWRDIFWIIFAAGLIATASGNSAVFGLVAGAGVILYVLSAVKHPTTQDK